MWNGGEGEVSSQDRRDRPGLWIYIAGMKLILSLLLLIMRYFVLSYRAVVLNNPF